MRHANDDEPIYTLVYESYAGARSYEYPSASVARHWFQDMWAMGSKGWLGFFRWQLPPASYDRMLLLDDKGRILMERETRWARIRRLLTGGRA